MNKRKLGAAVLLLALGLGPVQTSQNYNLKLNNLAYADGVTSEGEGTEGTQILDAGAKADTSEGNNEEGDKGGNQPTKDEPSTANNPNPSDNNEENPVSSTGNEGGSNGEGEEGKTLEERKKDLLDKIDTYESELGKSNAIKFATDAEREEHAKALEAFEKEIEKADEEKLKSLEDDSVKEEVERNYYKAVSKLGYRVYSARDARTELKKQIDKASKLLEIKKDPGLKEILAKSLVVYDDFTSQAKTISEITDELKKAIEDVSTKENIAEEKFALSKEEEKKIDDMEGFPSTIIDKLSDKDAFDHKLESLVKIDIDRATDFTEENLQKVGEKDSIKKYIEKRDALLAIIESDATDPDEIIKVQEKYDAAVAEAKSLVNDDKASKLSDKAAALKTADKEFRESENYKKLEKNKDIAIDEYVEAFKALDNATPADSNYEKLIEDVEAAKKVIEEGKGKGNKEEIDLQGKIDEALKADKHNEFINSDNYRRATASYQNAYKDAYKALTDERTKENLDKLKEAKKAIDDKDFVEEFDDKADQLESYIDKAKSDKITEESLKKLKEEYKEKLQALRDDKDADTDDIKALEDEFNGKLNPEKAEPGSIEAKDGDKKKTARKVVTSSKKSNGKVRTGVDAILPVVGGVAIVAAIALIFTRKKNK